MKIRENEKKVIQHIWKKKKLNEQKASTENEGKVMESESKWAHRFHDDTRPPGALLSHTGVIGYVWTRTE